jgi:hypothetical protein
MICAITMAAANICSQQLFTHTPDDADPDREISQTGRGELEFYSVETSIAGMAV